MMNQSSKELIEEIKNRPELKKVMKEYWQTSTQGGKYLTEKDADAAFEIFIGNQKPKPKELLERINQYPNGLISKDLIIPELQDWLHNKTEELRNMKTKEMPRDAQEDFSQENRNNLIEQIIKIIK